MKSLGITALEIPIKKAVEQHFSDIGHDPDKFDLTFENSQARERTQVLMDYAGKIGGFVAGTGDLSELALGWCTYNADHMSMYGVNCGIPKTLGPLDDRQHNGIATIFRSSQTISSAIFSIRPSVRSFFRPTQNGEDRAADRGYRRTVCAPRFLPLLYSSQIRI